MKQEGMVRIMQILADSSPRHLRARACRFFLATSGGFSAQSVMKVVDSNWLYICVNLRNLRTNLFCGPIFMPGGEGILHHRLQTSCLTRHKAQ